MPMGADFPIEIQGYKTNSLFDAGGHVTCISHGCYRKFSIEPKIYTKA